MRKRVKWSRPKRTLRNWLLVLLMALMLYGISGFPPLTKDALVKEILRKNLMTDGEVISEAKELLYIDCGNVVLKTRYRWYGVYYHNLETVVLVKDRGIVLDGALWVIGDLENVARGEVEVTLAGRKITRQLSHTFVTEGVKEGDHAMRFTLTAENEDQEWLLEKGLHFYATGEPRYDYTLRLYDAAGQEIGVWTDAPEQEAQ